MESVRAATLFGDCCGSTKWIAAMVARRPFAGREEVLTAADEIWSSLAPADWLEAFDHHPKIGERKAAVEQRERASGWSSDEQVGINSAGEDVVRALAEANREYEKRFGYIFIVCAAGKPASELLSIAQQRLQNTSDREIGIAAGEQGTITRLRLEKLLNDPEAK